MLRSLPRAVVGVAAALAVLLVTAALPAAESSEATPQWIWPTKTSPENQDAQLRKSFNVKKDVKSATLSVACDNWVVIQLNKTRLGQHYSWSEPLKQDVSDVIKTGKNTIHLHCRNSSGAAAVIAQLTVKYKDGSEQRIVTDGTWESSAEKPGGWTKWHKAVVLGKLGVQPWGDIPFGEDLSITGATPIADINVLPGFTVERVYSVPKGRQGSWVSLTSDNKGRLIACDQYGDLYRIIPGPPGKERLTKVEKLSVNIGHAQGLLYAYDSLYVMVNDRSAKPGSGLYRLFDTDGDDHFDKVTCLKKLFGPQGEHGPHAIRKGPDGRIWIICGNHTDIPEFEKDSPHQNFAEDLLLPRNPDGNGHATGRMAPGGWIANLRPDGSDWTLFCAGYRNAYDIAFNSDGELFTYDSDMEWDVGCPWYRPTRVNHCVSAAEFGWRYGTGKWPHYYVDSVGAVVEIGRGSPTGIEFGYGAKFPAKYQHALYISDWTFGKIYAVHLEPKGATYTATFEPFVSGRPFPATDVVINPDDGFMYITIGGRRMQSGLYRIRYTGDKSTEPAPVATNKEAAQARTLRRQLEVYHRKQDPRSIDFAWPKLANTDRSIRYAARVAIEHQPIESWRERAFAETRTYGIIEAMVAVARSASFQHPKKSHEQLQTKVLEKLLDLPIRQMTLEQKFDLCRAFQLAFIRLGGQPSDTMRQAVIDHLAPLVPAPNEFVNQELTKLLIYLEAPHIIDKSLARMHQVNSQQAQLFYIFRLRSLDQGWTLDQRRFYFSWIAAAEAHGQGGNSFVKDLELIRKDAMSHMSKEVIAKLSDAINGKADQAPVKLETKRAFVKNWKMSDFAGDFDLVEEGRSFTNGKTAYIAAQCFKCHRFHGTGGGTGPDITSVGARFSTKYILESLIQPSKAVSDQYRNSTFVTSDGEVLVGRVIKKTDTHVMLRTDPFAQELVKIALDDIIAQKENRTSMMPEGLINVLSKEEILDMIAYLRSAGKKSDPAFAPPGDKTVAK